MLLIYLLKRIVLTFLFCFIFVSVEVNAKIYDCFLFFNELEILEIRFDELYDKVDYFVLVESTKSFQGKPKPLYFSENKDRFSRYLDKVIHVVVTQEDNTVNGHWAREAFQRDQISQGLKDCQDGDIIIISDVDEIINGARLDMWLEPIKSGQKLAVAGNINTYRYLLNRFSPKESPMCCLYAVDFAYGKAYSPQELRRQARALEVEPTDHMGWHFTFMGGLDRVRLKLASYSHPESNTPRHTREKGYSKNIQKLIKVPVDASFPRLVYQNYQHYVDIGFIDP